MTAAHRTLPFGTRVRVTHVGSGRSVVVRINDRGPFHGGRIIDLAAGPAEMLGLKSAGSAYVSLQTLD
jgi:rare lipoprotein A